MRKISIIHAATCMVLLSALGAFATLTAAPMGDAGLAPTRENPLIIDEAGRRVLMYTEVNGKALKEDNPHWGVVSKDGGLADKAILKSSANHLEFHDALLRIGAKPGDNLTSDALGNTVEGSRLEVTATWPGMSRELKLEEIFSDSSGRGFDIRFGGNRTASAQYNTGCITCLESCWVAITSNARYPNISTARRAVWPNSRFRGRADVLPGDGKPVILIYRLADAR
jgi:hypothetical protein